MRLSNSVKWLALAAALLTSDGLAAQSAATLTGRVTDDAGAALSGVQVVVTHQVTGSTTGALSSADGRYVVAGVRAGGPYTVEARSIGYGSQISNDVMLEAGQTRTLDFRLTQEAIAMDAIEVFASRAVERKTPVAYTDVPKVQIQNQLGSRDLPMVLNVTPSVYSTMQGGGAGDARINVRGFSQRNTAVMINGVPVNDMENGWVYWSNWDGLGDAATSIQLQRGLSAINIATPAIGGTLNVITDPSAMRPGISYKQEFGSGNFLKETFVGHTGEMGNFALTASVVRKTGDGQYEGIGGANAAWTDAWAYYGAASYQIDSRNRLELYAVGAPQRHGQNLYKLNIATLDQDFARELGYEQAALEAFPEAGRTWSPNVHPVSESYDGLQYASSGPDAGTFERYAEGYINERENYFHKPQVNLNWYSYFGSGLTLSTVAYYSGGNGGGTGTLGSSRNAAFDYTYTQRVPDWNGTIAMNRARADGSSGYILRNSVNNQSTFGAISKLRKDFASDWTAEIGIDWRTAEVEHYRDVRDLLGGQYFVDTRNEFTGPRNAVFGDRIDYNNTNDISWLGAFAQAEKAGRNGSLYGMVGYSQNSYTFTDHFKRAAPGSSEELVLESGDLNGFQVKGGAVRNLNPEWSIFGNAGYVSKVPIFDEVIDDFNAVRNENPNNEKFTSFEGGVQFRSLNRGVSFDANFYFTDWNDRTYNLFVRNLTGDGQDGLINLSGVDARHMGVEASAAYQPNDLLRFDVAGSVGNWKYQDNPTATYKPDDRAAETETFTLYIDDLRVGDAPQTQVAYAVSLFPVEGFYVRAQGKTFANHWSEFSPFGRQDQSEVGVQPWKAPGYTVVDLHAAYRLGDILPAAGDLRIFGNLYNVFDKIYVQDAVDNSGFNGYHADGDRHDADSAEVFLGIPRSFNVGFEVRF